LPRGKLERRPVAVPLALVQSLLSLSQEQLATLGVAKDVGDNVGLLRGS